VLHKLEDTCLGEDIIFMSNRTKWTCDFTSYQV